eukprot:3414646-Amphidinium_carterae.2
MGGFSKQGNQQQAPTVAQGSQRQGTVSNMTPNAVSDVNGHITCLAKSRALSLLHRTEQRTVLDAH